MARPFPMGLALGDAFCNRDNERALLISNISNGNHTVLLAPRRYGKTSLATMSIEQSKLMYCQMDFLLAATPRLVESHILDRVGGLLHQLLPRTKTLKEKMLRLFHRMRPEITISALGQKVILHAPSDVARETTIVDVLLALDKAAESAKKRVVVFMDEFQQISELKDDHTIEASIRHAVERSKHVSYIFSGSNRHLLHLMFQDKTRPFYRLCSVMKLHRIKEADHVSFIQKQAKKKWNKALPDEVIKRIMAISMRHSYYVNLLCKFFWDKDKLPTIKGVNSMWKEYMISQQSLLASDLSLLSNNQKILIAVIAKHPTNQPFCHEYLQRSQLTTASQKEAMKKLMLKDYVYQDDDGFVRILDPAMQDCIAQL